MLHRLTLFCLIASASAQYDDYSSASSDDYASSSNDPAELVPQLQNVTYEINVGNATFVLEDLEPYNVTIDINLPDTKSLKHLFIICTAFIDAVWKPFESIEDFLFELLTLQEEDHLNYISDNWRQLAEFEIGYLICLIIGVLFILLVPLIGIFFCACRLCNNCGGRLYQDLKDAQSGWRIFHCLALMLTNTTMMIGMVFIYLTNDWVGQVFREIGPATLTNIDHVYGYTESISSQLDQVFESYVLVENATSHELSELGELLGGPIRDELQIAFDPLLGELGTFQVQLEEVLEMLNESDKEVQTLQSGVTNFENGLMTMKSALDSDMTFPNCGLNTHCRRMQILTEQLDIAGDFSDLNEMSGEIADLTRILEQNNFTEIISDAQFHIDSIPDKLDEYANETISGIIGPGGTFDQIREQIKAVLDEINMHIDLNQSVELAQVRNEVQSFTDNVDEWEYYRRIVGIVFASIIAGVVGANTLGLCLGFCGYKRQATPTNRSAASNVGGIFLMVSVAISFVFSWILMLMVIVTFTVGGHGERYVCQTLQENEGGNFTGLQFLQEVASDVFSIPMTVEISGANISLDLSAFMAECKNNTGLFELLELDQVFDLDELLNMSSYNDVLNEQFEAIGTLLNNQMSSFISKGQLEDLEGIKGGTWRNINYTKYLDEVRRGITTIKMADFATQLNETANNIIEEPDPMTLAEKNRIVAALQKHSYDTVALQRDHIEPMEGALDNLELMLRYLQANASVIDEQIDNIVAEINQLNVSLTTVVPEKLIQTADYYGSNLTQHVEIFSEWLNVQVKGNVGACQPIYGIYTNTLNIVCSYMVDSLNAFWFSLGWATFLLLPSIVFATKLYKWFRRMDQEEYFDEYMTGYDQQNHYYNDEATMPSDLSSPEKNWQFQIELAEKIRASKPSAPPINYLS